MKYERDLRRVVELVEAGETMPTRRDMKEHFEEEYGISVSEGTIHIHINQIKKGQPLWRK